MAFTFAILSSLIYSKGLLLPTSDVYSNLTFLGRLPFAILSKFALTCGLRIPWVAWGETVLLFGVHLGVVALPLLGQKN